MNHFRLNRVVVVLGLLAALATVGFDGRTQDLSAEQIMQASNDRYQGDDFQSQIELTTTDAQGNSSALSVDLVAKLVPDSAPQHRYNLVATVSAPADAAGLAVLVHEQQFDTPDDIWLFLPALGSAKKIVPENFRTPLFGSEFTFEELVDREPGLGRHELVRPDTLDGRKVWVVKSTPLDPEIAGFAYRITFVDQETLLQLRMERYDDFDTMIKLFSTQKVETVDGVPTRILSTAQNLETGRTSTFEFLNPRYNVGGVSDTLFDPEQFGR